MKRTRWTARIVGGLLTLFTANGCKQQLFLEPGDFHSARMAGIPDRIESHPHEPIDPSRMAPANSPATTYDPARPAKPVSLKECVAVALEQGNTGSQGGPQNAGGINDNIGQFTGQGVTGTDSIKAFVYDPAVFAANIERALSKFDARWINTIQWQKLDQPNQFNLFQFQSSQDRATLTSTLAKPLPTGGLAGITFSVDYTKVSRFVAQAQQNQLTNPSYVPRIQFTFEQPLLQAFGVEVNQLLPQHPGGILQQIRPSGGAGEGILITRLRFEQSRAEFDRQVNLLLLNVEAAYWNLYAAYYNLYAQEEVLKQAFDLLQKLQRRFEAGTLRLQDLEQTRAQFYLFRQNVISARLQVLSAERQLRGLLGMRSDDGFRLVPADDPTLARFRPEYNELIADALAYRPELSQARQELKVQQLNLVLQKNLRRPDVRFFSTYDIAGIGTRLDGPPGENAFRSLADNRFNSWQLGLRGDIPIGFRDANASVHQSRLQLFRAFRQLEDFERKTVEIIADQMRQVESQQQLIEEIRGQRIALQRNLELQNILILGGAWDVNQLFNLLQVQRDVAAAVATEFRAIGQYNAALAGLEWAKGTIQRYNNVSVNEGPLPPGVAKKAADHFAEREKGIKLRERPADHPLPPLTAPREPLPDGLPPLKFDAPPAGGPAANPPATLPTPRPMAAPKEEPKAGPVPMMVNQWPTAPATLPPAALPPAAETSTTPAGPPAEVTFSPIGTATIPRRNTAPIDPGTLPAIIPPAAAPASASPDGWTAPKRSE